MSLESKIKEDITSAMKAKDATRLSVLRMLKAAITNTSIEKGKSDLSDDEVLGLVQKQVKQRKESIDNYEKAGRADLVAKEKEEAEILVRYLPKQLSDEELRELIQAAIEKTSATTKMDMGKIMKEVMPQVKGRADGQAINRIAGEMLN